MAGHSLPRIAALGACLAASVAVSADRTAHGPASTTAEEANSAAQPYVEAALRYAATGETEFRNAMLREALEADPQDPAANWHADRIQVDGRWMSLAEAVTAHRGDATVADYHRLRERAEGDARRQLQLARWCIRQGWRERGRLHYATLLRDPNTDPRTRQTAEKALGLKYVGGVLLSPEELDAVRKQAEQIDRTLRHWRPKMERWRESAENRDAQHESVRAALDAIDDPDVVWAAGEMLNDSGPRFGMMLADLVGRFPEQPATTVLVRFAVLSPWDDVRQTATDHLKSRSLYGYVPDLLEGLMATTQSQWGIQVQPDGSVRYQHLLYREGSKEVAVVARDHLASPRLRPLGDLLGATRRPGATDRGGSDRSSQAELPLHPLVQLAEASEALSEAASRQRAVAFDNAQAAANNERIFDALEATTGANVERDPVAWWYWWEKTNETVRPKLTRYAYLPSRSRLRGTSYVPTVVRSSACFAPGTPVWTAVGRKPIEQVRIGDRVLAQDPDSGELALKLVLDTTAGQPTAAQMRLSVDGDTILPTLGHVFWVSGKGWRLAKELEAGDHLHGRHGGLLVEELEEQPAPPVVHNLVVEDFHTYFVGTAGILVHDITTRRPCRAVVPGLRADDFQPLANRTPPSPTWLRPAGW